jgi:2-dehydropantoate 2-reductase
VAEALARRQPDATAVCAQNGVGHEARLAPLFPRVLGLVVRQTSTRHRANAVRATGGGRCVVGVEPGSRDREGAIAARDELVGALAAAGFDAGATDDLAADRWLKLCINLMSAPNALVRREDHPGRAFAELKARLLEEARAALGAEGIRAASGDGRDRSLDAEIEHLRNASQRGDGARPWPIYNSVWTALRGGGPFEVLEFHRRIVEMAGRHGLPAPTNRRVIEVLERSEREGLGPERWAAADLVDSRAP